MPAWQSILIALAIWTVVSCALGGLCALAFMKIKRRKKFLAERGLEEEIVGDFTLIREKNNERA